MTRPPARIATRLLYCALILVAALGLYGRAEMHDPEPTGGLQFSFGEEEVDWPGWRPGATVSELWREHGVRLRDAGVRALWLWDGASWSGYAVDGNGRTVPGSTDFEFTLSGSSRYGYSGGLAGVRIDLAAVQQGDLAGIVEERNILGQPDAPVLIIDYSDFL